MEKVKRVRVNGLGAVKDERGGLDRRTEGRRTKRGWLTLGGHRQASIHMKMA
jgi:hypothetical protein